MSLDPAKNFAKVTVSTGYAAGATSIVLSSGDGAKLPDPSTDGAFNLVWWDSTTFPDPADDPLKEIVRCTARSGDTLTVTRGQEGTSDTAKNTGAVVYLMLLGVTKKMIDDIQTRVDSPTSNQLKLYTQQHFDGNVLPFQNIFFDGFGDDDKTDASSSNVTVGRKFLELVSGQTSGIYYSVKQELQQAVTSVKLWVSRGRFSNTANSYDHAGDFEAGSTDRATITDEDQVGLDLQTPDGDFTLEWWMKVESMPGDNMNIFSKGSSWGAGYSWGVVYNGGDDTIQLAIADDSAGPSTVLPSTDIDLSVGSWKHYSVTWDQSTTTAAFYVDGSYIASGTNAGITGIYDGTQDFVLAGAALATAYDGMFSDVRVWDHKRSADDIMAHWNRRLVGNETGLVAYWRLDNNWRDSGPNRNDLTKVSAATFGTSTPTMYNPEDTSFAHNLAAGISQGATSLTITGDVTSEFSNGDTIDIYDQYNYVRERKTISGAPSFGGGVTTITFTPSVSSASGFGTSDFVERVDVLPQISVVSRGGGASYSSPTYVRSQVNSTTSMVEDEYSLNVSGVDAMIKLTVTRNSTSLYPKAEFLGTSFEV